MIKNRAKLKIKAMFSYNSGTRNQYVNIFGINIDKKWSTLFYNRTYKWKRNLGENITIVFNNKSMIDFKDNSIYMILNKKERKVFDKWLPAISLMFKKKELGPS